MNKSLTSQFAIFALCAALALSVTACGEIKKEAKYPTGYDRTIAGDDDIYGEGESIFGGEGLLGAAKKQDDGNGSVGVNAFLWRASLDTVSFMPLASADPFGGVILTDWYTPPENPLERFKLNVFIMGRELRSDGVRVRAFRQKLEGGVWKDVAVTDGMGTQLEDTILTRARQLRVVQAGGE